MVQVNGSPTHFAYHGNIHMHTTHSDGFGSFEDLIDGAVKGGLDFVYVTDHNVLVREQEEGYRRGVLTLVGQEVHDTQREPPGNHLLCLGVESDVSSQASDPQKLIEAVKRQNGLTFLAHPIEERTELFSKCYPWHSWEVTDFHGVELWNYLSGFRGFTTSYLRAAMVGFFPRLFADGPLPEMLAKWDELTQERPVVALGGTDVHAIKYRLGPISRRFLSYEESAKALNTHILTNTPLLGPTSDDSFDFGDPNTLHDRNLVVEALRKGHCWLGYDLVGSTQEFRFWAEGERIVEGEDAGRPAVPRSGDAEALGVMGDSVSLAEGSSVTLKVRSPEVADIRILRNGRVVTQGNAETLTYQARDAGVYRVEVWKQRWGKQRGWIFSNPIYVNRNLSGAG